MITLKDIAHQHKLFVEQSHCPVPLGRLESSFAGEAQQPVDFRLQLGEIQSDAEEGYATTGFFVIPCSFICGVQEAAQSGNFPGRIEPRDIGGL